MSQVSGNLMVIEAIMAIDIDAVIMITLFALVHCIITGECLDSCDLSLCFACLASINQPFLAFIHFITY